MKNTKVPLAVFALIFSACNPKYYVPNTQNVPLLTNRGEFTANVATNGNQFEGQAAIGLNKNTGIQVNGGWFAPKDLDNGNGGSGKFGEIGIGYSRNLGKTLVFETYGLFGLGSVENHLPSTIDSAKTTTGKIFSNVQRFAIQPAIGYKGRKFEVALSSRIGYLTFSKPSGSLIYNNMDQVQYLKDNATTMLVEPAVTLRYGYKNLKFQAQLGQSFNLTNANFLQDKSWLTVGLQFRFGGVPLL